MTVPWITVWGYGADIRATVNSLTIKQNGQSARYNLDDISHLLIAGGHLLHTASVPHLLAKDICITFFDVHGGFEGRISKGSDDSKESQLHSLQKRAQVHKLSMAIIRSSLKSRMLFLNELAEEREDGLYYKGELEILTDATRELEYLITRSEISRVFELTKNMYYEILSRVVPEEFSYHRREKPPYMDPVNAMFAHGYAVLHANISVALEGAGLDSSIGVLSEGSHFEKTPLVSDLMEVMQTSMVDKTVISMVRDGFVTENYEVNLRCVLSDDLMKEFNKRLGASINHVLLDENVNSFSKSICESSDLQFWF